MALFPIFGPRIKYSRDKHQVTASQVENLVRSIDSANVSQENKEAVIQAVINCRDGDNRASLQSIYEVLNSLKNKNRITKIDQDTCMKAFLDFFTLHFK